MSRARLPGISGDTRVFAILGDPIAHSLSPRIHNAAFAACGLDAVFIPLRTEGDAVPHLLRALARAGGGGSITVPHKQAAAVALDHALPAVTRTGACNTFWDERGALCGDNTDVVGFRDAARHHDVALRDAQVLLLGAGGAASAVLAVLQEESARVVVCSRTPARAHDLLAHLGMRGEAEVAAGPPARHFDVIINATSLGLHADDPLPLAVADLRAGTVLLDVVYAPGTTRWVRLARERGLAAFDGAEMLLRQAAAAFRHWTGREPPLDVMRGALEDAVA